MTYHFRQYFRQWWMLLIVLILFVVNFYVFVSQIIVNQPVGDHPASDNAVIAIFLFMMLLLGFFLAAHLDLQIDKNGIAFRFWPFHFKWRKYAWDDVEELEIQRIRPIRDMGGWGIRVVSNGGIAYTVSGHYAIKLKLKNGKIRYIGVKEPESVRDALLQIAPKNK